MHTHLTKRSCTSCFGVLYIFMSFSVYGQINEFHYTGTDKKMEFVWIGLASGPRSALLYDATGHILDTVPFSSAIDIQQGSEGSYYVEYYVLSVPTLPSTGGIAIGITSSTSQVLVLEEFISFGLSQPLMAIDGPFTGSEASMIPNILLAEGSGSNSLQLIDGNWYNSPQTYGRKNHIGCPDADTTYVDLLLCEGQEFECTPLYIIVEDEVCTQTFIGSDNYDSTVIYDIKFVQPEMIAPQCPSGPCMVESDFLTSQSITLFGNHVIQKDTKILLNAGISTTLGAGFEANTGAVLLISTNSCK